MEAKENWPNTMDGKLWAEAFCQRFPQCKVDDVLGWFCNAIMAGYDRGKQAGIKEVVQSVKQNAAVLMDGQGSRSKTIGLGIDIEEWQAKLKEWELSRPVSRHP